MIFYRKQIEINNSNEEIFLQKKGIFKIIKEKQQLIKDYQELKLNFISLESFLEVGKYSCYQIPSNRIDYFFRDFNNNNDTEEISITLTNILLKNNFPAKKVGLFKKIIKFKEISSYNLFLINAIFNPNPQFFSFLPSCPSLLRGSLTLRPLRLCGSLKTI